MAERGSVLGSLLENNHYFCTSFEFKAACSLSLTNDRVKVIHVQWRVSRSCMEFCIYANAKFSHMIFALVVVKYFKLTFVARSNATNIFQSKL